ncbi:hypothetical protein [Limnohabitans sp. 63ED37-2]|uniref:hypothetical protein n=1 Tax=Limnohabitans sp. 63ED37-2 TaxID=1678128 RepID=UPI000705A91F|nr:hypothetical protein [Limnohabitans sp. 63ED37-2]ALK90182.1 hypothetical protein L63ED372_02984 [Limnohabitans sp. 63ED37-2]
MNRLTHIVGFAALSLAAIGPAAAAPSQVVLSCAVAYLPQRSTWVREVRIDWDKKAIRSLHIDGLQPHGFSLIPQGVMTAVDNERIQIDLVTRQWQSDFRGHATGQGRCETVPG